METTKVTVNLIQEKGAIQFSKEVQSNRITEISGTISQNIIAFAHKVKRYKMKLDNFSFARKFQVKVTIENRTIDFNEVTGCTNVLFALTINNEANFANFINEFVEELLTNDSQSITDLSEILQNTGVEVPA